MAQRFRHSSLTDRVRSPHHCVYLPARGGQGSLGEASMPRSLSALPLLLFLLAPIARADQASLPGCEAPSALRKAIKNQLESKEFRHLYFQLREERQQRVLSELF